MRAHLASGPAYRFSEAAARVGALSADAVDSSARAVCRWSPVERLWSRAPAWRAARSAASRPGWAPPFSAERLLVRLPSASQVSEEALRPRERSTRPAGAAADPRRLSALFDRR